MKMIYQFLIVCSVFLFSFQENWKNINAYVVSDCMDASLETNGYTCCFYNETYKDKERDFLAHCAESPKDEVIEHRKEVNYLMETIGGERWIKIEEILIKPRKKYI